MTIDVVVAGAGPNGLFLATELRRAGVKPVVLERLPEPARRPKANGLVGRVVQMLDYRGLHERIAGGSPPPGPAPRFQFAGFPLDLGALGDHSLRVLQIRQPLLEARLAEYLRELGGEIRRGHELLSFEQDEDGVTVDVQGPQGTYRLRTRYLVGADGGSSVVRKLAGIPFPGTTEEGFVSTGARVVIPRSEFVAGTGELDTPAMGRLVPFQWHRGPHGVFTFAELEPGLVTIATGEWNRPPVDDSVPPTLAELRAAVLRVTGRELRMSRPDGDAALAWNRRSGNNTRQAGRYREGRVLLVGDAAHVHHGIGAPGLNLGLQDGFNLGWKLAAEIRGWAPPGLLSTYHSERHPVGRRVVLHTRAQMALLSPAEGTTAIREIFGELLDETIVRRRLAELLAGGDVRYPTPGPPHPLLGRWMPDLPLTGGGVTRVAELMRGPRAVLLDFAGKWADAVRPWRNRVDHVRADGESSPAPAVLVRPDGFVAWAGETGLEEALTTWFGAPATDRSPAVISGE